MRYRKDIQVLRGVSVLLVVLFHLGVTGFKSGFLGVDVFLVISGYLMAVMYDPTRKREFFAKRARRLLPAYFVALGATLAACLILTLPNDFEAAARQALFATAFSSNVGYWMENSYFSKAAFNPLLHLWSLGLEIQFYLLLPLLAWLFGRLGSAFVLTLIGSLAACFVVLGVSPKTAFFLTPFRLWEFLLGYGVAARLADRQGAPRPGRAWLGAAGLVLVTALPAMPVDGFALNALRGHPGLPALGACLATTLVLAAGLPPVVESWRLTTILETVGKYSYSIYLAHFPIIVLFLYQPFSGTILKTDAPRQTLILATLCAAGGLLLHRLVETRFRSASLTPRRLLAFALAPLLLVPAGAVFNELTAPAAEKMISGAWADKAGYRCGKINRLTDPLAITCEITDPLPQPAHRVLLVGNSHADSIKRAFADVAQGRNCSVRFMVENNPLMPGGLSPEALIQEARSRKADALVLHFSPGAIQAAVVERLARLAESEGMTVSFLLPVPVWPEHVPKTLWTHLKTGAPLPVTTLADYSRNNARLLGDLAAMDRRNLMIYSVAPLFCAEECRMTSAEGKPFYFDQEHLTLTGSDLLRGMFGQVLSDLPAVHRLASTEG